MEFNSLMGPKDPNNNKSKGENGKASGKDSFEKLPVARKPKQSRNGLVWASLGLLTAGFVAAGAFGYEQIEANRNALPDLATNQSVEALQGQVDSLDGRLSNLVGRVATSDTVEGLVTRIGEVEGALRRGLEATRGDIAEVREASADLEWRIQSTVEACTSPIRERLAELESAEQGCRVDLMALEQKVEALGLSMESQVADLRHDESLANQQIEGRIAGTERRLDIVSYAVDKSRFDFEMYKDFDEQVAPGVTLHLTDVDRRFQNVSGWIWLVDDVRFLRIEDHPIQQSLVFYTHQDERPYELIFTRVTESAAVGYMRVPSDSLVQTADEDWKTPSIAVDLE